MLLPALTLATGITECVAPAIIPWKAGPRDTVFIEIERGNKGCLFVDGNAIPGPPFVVSAAFAARPDSTYLGVAINHLIPAGLKARTRGDSLMTPERARRFVTVHKTVQATAYGPEGVDALLKLLSTDARIASVHVDSVGAFAQSVTIQWKDEPVPWSADLTLPFFVRIPGDPRGFFPMWGIAGPLIVFTTGRSFEYLGPGGTHANGRPCSP